MELATELQFDWHAVVLIVAVVQGLILSTVILFTSASRNRAGTLLGLTFLFYSLMLIDEVLFSTRLLLRLPYLADSFSILILVVPPTFYLYVRSAVQPERPLTRIYWLHYLPFLIFLLVSLPNYFVDHKEALETVIGYYEVDQFYFNSTVILPLVQLSAYLGAVFLMLRRHRVRMHSEFSSLKRYGFSWMPYMLGVVGFLWLGWLFCYLMRRQDLMQVLDIAYTLFIYSLAYLGWRQAPIPALSVAPGVTDVASESEDSAAEKYVRSGLSTEQAIEIKNKLLQYIQEKEPFLDPELTLPELSNQIGVSANHLSQVINEEFGQNFYEFINRFRVEKAMLYLRAPEHNGEKILTIAFNSGFNSKSAFNASFKRHAGMTPRDFRVTNPQIDPK